MTQTLASYIAQVQAGSISPRETVLAYLEKAERDNSTYNAYITISRDHVLEHLDEQVSTGPLFGAPIAVKDLILTQGVKTTFGSKMSENFIPPYSATCFRLLEECGMSLIGKTNLDEYAMGTTNESSAYGPVLNPIGTQRIPGGSSGGSAAAVAADMCLAALGTDTGGSVRQPACMCGVVGMKPTYGRISRYGVQSMASSFDQVGVITKTVEDACLLVGLIAGHDPHDSTSIERHDTSTWMDSYTNGSLAGKKIGYLEEFFDEGLDPAIAQHTRDVLARCEQAGATIVPLSFPLMKYMVAVYYILMPAEVSTNLARFDGLRYGLQDDTASFGSIKEYYAAIRDTGFGDEVKRRILMGSYVLSAGFYDAYYRKAQQVRRVMQEKMNRLFDNVDLILGPTSPELAWKLGESVNDPLRNYLADVYTIPANMGGYPAMHIPTTRIERDGETYACGVQVMAPHRREDLIWDIGGQIEKIMQ